MWIDSSYYWVVPCRVRRLSLLNASKKQWVAKMIFCILKVPFDFEPPLQLHVATEIWWADIERLHWSMPYSININKETFQFVAQAITVVCCVFKCFFRFNVFVLPLSLIYCLLKENSIFVFKMIKCLEESFLLGNCNRTTRPRAQFSGFQQTSASSRSHLVIVGTLKGP